MTTEHKDQVKPPADPATTPKSTQGSIGELVAKITSQFSALVRDEIKYTTLQAQTKVKRLGVGGVLLAVAGIFALYMLGFIFTSIAMAFALIVPEWAGYLITAGILLVIILILALIGKRSLDKAKKTEIDPKSGLTKNVDAIKKGFEK
ncbi:phage holin family protein [Arcanobacterium pinnipediorum]|uniref:Phage holin family protein n=1 Tax=Arcanobacterium pinnipediorum TaxID=1503041 RepID=A0ABY5AI36_9ACTO|nr:phage holin family protein [Arcanobacterium pinnipediorum]USR79588.1 phage holin family protein [Arcanobacterium pinnipediorum]